MGPAIKDEDIKELYKKLDKIKDGDILVLAGSIPSVMPETMYSDIMEHLKKMQQEGARNVLVSMAGEGAVLVAENGEVYKSKCPEGKVKNSVGAGDSMVAGFIAGYLKSGDYKEALRNGLLTGSASAFSDNLATKEEVENLGKTFEM